MIVVRSTKYVRADSLKIGDSFKEEGIYYTVCDTVFGLNSLPTKHVLVFDIEASTLTSVPKDSQVQVVLLKAVPCNPNEAI